ncbi:glucokinase [Spiribacter salinus M19-40]|uniref:Glucokinase n=1 Tax=Spiribacter salinus M19-40 TaxID=1260251 RepID=R4VJW8_9GAMM|nr:glucokinase [Spiribacter salinus]AGM40812.1 glucokinase [Spiribacter salinus M19-40]
MSTGRPDQPWLVADIGGTNVRVAVVKGPQQRPQTLCQLATADYGNLAEMLSDAFTRVDGPPPRQVACALASPAAGDDVRLTNAGWHFSVLKTQAQLGLERLEVINDWVAQGWAVPTLNDNDLRTIQPGTPDPDAPRIALGPGTGLGTTLMTPHNGQWQVFAAEGGHISVAPTNAREAELILELHRRFGHCSAERIASGTGLESVYSALCHMDQCTAQAQDAEAIGQAATAGDAIALEAIDLLTRILGSATGDLMLATGARGGVYIGGGLIPALGKHFDWQAFRTRLQQKGRFDEYLRQIPVWLITHEAPALLGLAHYLEETA